MNPEINSPVDTSAIDRMVSQEPAPVVEANYEDATDELSVAVREARKPAPVTFVEPEKPEGKYQLDYLLDGKPIHETHATIRLALARVEALRRIGIIARTSTITK
ncbi:MAG: hypothetical protein KGJ13_06550 [Patescibacteria group bacterium]|nr:hypothetical protein [Patescibacteria group bacterium]